jgi:hypothetical protein
MAALLEFDRFRAPQAPTASSSRAPEPGASARRAVLAAAWALGPDNRLACRWNQETSPPD